MSLFPKWIFTILKSNLWYSLHTTFRIYHRRRFSNSHSVSFAGTKTNYRFSNVYNCRGAACVTYFTDFVLFFVNSIFTVCKTTFPGATALTSYRRCSPMEFVVNIFKGYECESNAFKRFGLKGHERNPRGLVLIKWSDPFASLSPNNRFAFRLNLKSHDPSRVNSYTVQASSFQRHFHHEPSTTRYETT